MAGRNSRFNLACHFLSNYELFEGEIFNFDGIIFKNKEDESKALNEIEKEELILLLENDGMVKESENQKKEIEIWFENHYYDSILNGQVYHFFGKESLMKKYIPKYVSSNYKVCTLEGNHDNILEIESNLEFIVSKII